MVVPTDTPVTLALRSQGGVQAVAGNGVQVTAQGTANGYNLYSLTLTQNGPTMVNVTYNGGRTSILQYNSIKPIESTIGSYANFLTTYQQAKTTHGYNGAFMQWDMTRKTQITYQNYPGGGWEQWMAGGSDDQGLSHAEFLSEYNRIKPNQTQIAALDYYIQNFLFGYLQSQKTSSGALTYNVYRWYDGQDGTPSDQGTWRSYNYIHIANTYLNMYKVSKAFPTLTFKYKPLDYLNFCYQTLNAMFQINPNNPIGDSVHEYGLMGEQTYPDILASLNAEGMTSQASAIKSQLQNKYNYLAAQKYPFASEQSIDTTGFEGCYTLATIFNDNSLADKTQQASVASRGLQPAWYWYGSDNRNMGESWWNLGYEAQLGAWQQQDYLIRGSQTLASSRADQIRSTYGAYLSGWSNINTGQISSDPANYGAAAWIYQSELGVGNGEWGFMPQLNGWWAWTGEASLGFWGGLRTASAALVNDPVVGLYCFNGAVTTSSTAWTITPKDGVRQRVVLLNQGNLSVQIGNAQYTSATIATNLSSIQMTLASVSSAASFTTITFRNLPSGTYGVKLNGNSVGTFTSDGVNASTQIAGVTSGNPTLLITKQ